MWRHATSPATAATTTSSRRHWHRHSSIHRHRHWQRPCCLLLHNILLLMLLLLLIKVVVVVAVIVTTRPSPSIHGRARGCFIASTITITTTTTRVQISLRLRAHAASSTSIAPTTSGVRVLWLLGMRVYIERWLSPKRPAIMGIMTAPSPVTAATTTACCSSNTCSLHGGQTGGFSLALLGQLLQGRERDEWGDDERSVAQRTPRRCRQTAVNS
mmetsp:Transcript_29925/g.50600  ORF Transcript_29925/g.50600 Transcript_29925/m.50600 type:complete len:214 (+) Transcript_29925:322-963(+)